MVYLMNYDGQMNLYSADVKLCSLFLLQCLDVARFFSEAIRRNHNCEPLGPILYDVPY